MFAMCSIWRTSVSACAWVLCGVLSLNGAVYAIDQDDLVARDQQRRIETIERITPASVCVYDANKRGGGSGVLIDKNGYGITNFHVVRKMLAERRAWGGLGDGEFYEMEVLGIDPTGDVAMFRLLDEQRFPSVTLGDSSAMRVGDPVIVLGDPFILSEDNMPTVTMGIITGVHRYQGGTKGNLTYSDCIQTDAPINPGNSGGPLFNDRGEVIGINGRISVGARGRFNVGHGFAIASNQIRRFVPALRAGLLARHGTLHATVKEGASGAVEFDKIAADSPARDAGIRRHDKIISFDGVTIRSANHYLSVLGTYPEDWPVPVVFRHGSDTIEKLIRLAPVEPNIRFEYIAASDANDDQIKRVLTRFHAATTKDEKLRERGGQFKWTTIHGDVDAPIPDRATATRFDIVHVPGQSARLKRQGKRGSLLEFTFDDIWAEKPDGELLLPESQMVYTALYLLDSLLVTPRNSLDLTVIEFVGADAPIKTAAEAAADRERGRAPEMPWEVLAWQTPGGLTVKISFEPTTGLARRVRAFDPASGNRVSIELRDHRDFGGFTWPRILEVSLPEGEYTTEVLALERQP